MKWQLWYDVSTSLWSFTSSTLTVDEFVQAGIRYFIVSWNSTAPGSLFSDITNKLGGELSFGSSPAVEKIEVYFDGSLVDTLYQFPTYYGKEFRKLFSQAEFKLYPTGPGLIQISNSVLFSGDSFSFEVNPESIDILPYELPISQIPTTSEPAISIGGRTFPTISFKGIIMTRNQARNFYRWARVSAHKVCRLITDESVYDGILTKFSGVRLPKAFPTYYVEYDAEFLVTSVVSGVEFG